MPPQHDDQHHGVDETFGQDGAEAGADRNAGVAFEEVTAIGVAQFRGDDGVGEVGQTDDLG